MKPRGPSLDERASCSGETGKQDEPDAFHDQKMNIGSVTVRWPLKLEVLPLLALFFSFLPWLAPAFMVLFVGYTHTLACMVVLGLMVVSTGVAEFCLKPLLNEPRPATSAVRYDDGRLKPGMPSAHVLNSQSVTSWLILEAIYSLPSAWSALTLPAAILVMLAVPWARWYNGDHTLKQCLASVFLGTALGALTFALHMCYYPEVWAQATLIDMTNHGVPMGHVAITDGAALHVASSAIAMSEVAARSTPRAFLSPK